VEGAERCLRGGIDLQIAFSQSSKLGVPVAIAFVSDAFLLNKGALLMFLFLTVSPLLTPALFLSHSGAGELVMTEGISFIV